MHPARSGVPHGAASFDTQLFSRALLVRRVWNGLSGGARTARFCSVERLRSVLDSRSTGVSEIGAKSIRPAVGARIETVRELARFVVGLTGSLLE